MKTSCETRKGIGLCDECSLPKWPQEYVGYGMMICLDCLNKPTPKVDKVQKTLEDKAKRS